MGSMYVTNDENTINVLGKDKKVPFLLQFVSGYCVDVVHSNECINYTDDSSINTIIALPHYNDELVSTRGTAVGEEYRYYPLLRTVHDVPSKGDPVLLRTIGRVNYYLGPLNTPENNPTWNTDNNYRVEQLFKESIGKAPTNENLNSRGMRGEGLNFNKETIFPRMVKYRNPVLDYGNSIHETTGDTMIEGRHGNSVRIGSRNNNPYIFISNERDSQNIKESLGDGSLISITSYGSLLQHFGDYQINTGETNELVKGFTLASDLVIPPEESPSILMKKIISDVNIQDYNFDLYIGNQMLLHSDRIIINSKSEDMFLSSNNDIHLGTKRHLTISTNKDFIINSNRTFFGNPTNRQPLENFPPTESEINETVQKGLMQPMVLGTTLLQLLKETLAVIKGAQGLCQGAPLPLADDTGAPGGVNAKITQIEQRIEQILSNKHYIEPNT